MKKISVFMMAIVLLIACASAVPPQQFSGVLSNPRSDNAQIDIFELLPGESIEIVGSACVLEGIIKDTWVVSCVGGIVPPTVTPVPPTDTPIPPTDTPIPGAGIRDGVPLCAEHDPNAWHPVYNQAMDCHYDHHHGRNPYDSEIVALLGSPEEYTGQGIGYSWQTPNENQLKHRAYYWLWEVNDECVPSLIGDLCTKAFRFELHGDMGVLGAKTRFHSYWAEIMGCKVGTDDCGVVRFGGWLDTGCLYDNYFGDLHTTSQDPPNCLKAFPNNNAYRVLNQLDDKDNALSQWQSGNWPAKSGTVEGQASGRILWASGHAYSDYAQPMRNLVFGYLDNWAVASAGNLDAWEYICPDFQCPFNGSLGHVSNFSTNKFVAGSDSYYTDLQGFRDDACTETSAECVPFMLEDWPGGNVGYHRNRQYKNGISGTPYHPRNILFYYEFDQSPAQLGLGTEWWLVPTDYQYGE